MTRFIFCLLFGASALSLAQNAPDWHPPRELQTIGLWPGNPPGAAPNQGPQVTKFGSKPVGGRSVTILTDVSHPALTIYPPPKGMNTGAAVLIVPGGGYGVLAIDLEGTEVAAWLNSIGITGILVEYRVPESGPYPKSSAALEDAQRALGLIRSRASEWGLDPHKIGVIGFSAGGNLAAWLSNNYSHRLYPVADAADAVSCRPDFSILIYPAYLAAPGEALTLIPDLKIDPAGPPAFLVQAENDPVRVQNAMVYYWALHEANVPAEMHLYAQGGHGYGLRPAGLPITEWPSLAAIWLHTIAVLK